MKAQLRLYVSGATPISARATVNLRRFCEQHLKGRYELEILVISENVMRARADHIVAAPTLVKLAPEPVRRFVGDLSDVAALHAEFGIRSACGGAPAE